MIMVADLSSGHFRAFVFLTMINLYRWAMKSSNIEKVTFAGYLLVFLPLKGRVSLIVIRDYNFFGQDQLGPDLSYIELT